MLVSLLIASGAKSQNLPAINSLAKDTLCLNLDAVRELVTLAEEGVIVKADNAKLKNDTEAYRKGSAQLRLALEAAEKEIFNVKKVIEFRGQQLSLCQDDNTAKDKQITQEQKRTRRAKTGQKIISGIGLAGIAAAVILLK